MLTSYGPEHSKSFKELSLIYGPATAKIMIEQQKKKPARKGKSKQK